MAKKRILPAVAAALVVSCLVLAAGLSGLYWLRPVVVRTDDSTRLALLLRRQTGTIRFVNSVTGGSVEIGFTLLDRFRNFSVTTDAATEAYYSHGVYQLNDAVAAESTASLKFCSMKGIALQLGFFTYTIQDGCLEADVLWTM